MEAEKNQINPIADLERLPGIESQSRWGQELQEMWSLFNGKECAVI